jgi:hypothetical protein
VLQPEDIIPGRENTIESEILGSGLAAALIAWQLARAVS